MELTVRLNSDTISTYTSNSILIGHDTIKKDDRTTDIEWFFDALNYSTIVKSELELKNKRVFTKVKLIYENKEIDNLDIPDNKIYPNCILSNDVYSFLQHQHDPEQRCKEHPIRIVNIFKWVADSLTYDKVATISNEHIFKYSKQNNKIYAIEGQSDKRMSNLNYIVFKMFNNLSINSYEI